MSMSTTNRYSEACRPSDRSAVFRKLSVVTRFPISLPQRSGTTQSTVSIPSSRSRFSTAERCSSSVSMCLLPHLQDVSKYRRCSHSVTCSASHSRQSRSSTSRDSRYWSTNSRPSRPGATSEPRSASTASASVVASRGNRPSATASPVAGSGASSFSAMPCSPPASMAAIARYGLTSAPARRCSSLAPFGDPVIARMAAVRLSTPHEAVTGVQVPGCSRRYALTDGLNSTLTSAIVASCPARYCRARADSPPSSDQKALSPSRHRLWWKWQADVGALPGRRVRDRELQHPVAELGVHRLDRDADRLHALEERLRERPQFPKPQQAVRVHGPAERNSVIPLVDDAQLELRREPGLEPELGAPVGHGPQHCSRRHRIRRAVGTVQVAQHRHGPVAPRQRPGGRHVGTHHEVGEAVIRR